MKIQGKFQGDMVGFSLKHNPDNGARFATVKIDVSADREHCKRLFGDEIERLAFGPMQVSHGGEDEGEAGVSFGYKKLTPDAVCEFHQIQILGHKQSVQPVVKQIAPVRNKEEVVVTIELPILVKKDQALAGALVAEFGELVEVEADPAQQELNLNGGGVVIQHGAFGNPQAAVTG